MNLDFIEIKFTAPKPEATTAKLLAVDNAANITMELLKTYHWYQEFWGIIYLS